MRLNVSILISVMCILIATGCNNNSTDEIEETQEDNIQYEVIGIDPIILLHDLVEAGMDMEVDGTLKYDSSNKCLFLYSKEEIISIPIWPEGTTPLLEDNLRGVSIPGYGTVWEEEEISTAGGGVNYATIADQGFDSGCLDNENIIIITP